MKSKEEKGEKGKNTLKMIKLRTNDEEEEEEQKVNGNGEPTEEIF